MPIYINAGKGAGSTEDFQNAILDIGRRAVDGTVVPLFVDASNQRVIVGAAATAGSNSKFQVQNGDAEVIGSSYGVILTDSGGSGNRARLQALYDSGSGNWTLTITGL